MIPRRQEFGSTNLLATPKTFNAFRTVTQTIPNSNVLAGNIDFTNLPPLKIDEIVGTTKGSTTINGANLEFLSNEAAGEVATIFYKFSNAFGFTGFGSVDVALDPVPPLITNAITVDVQQGSQVLISESALIANDSTSFPPITVTGVQNPVGGTLNFNSPNITYTSTGISGDPASFEYTVTDDVGNTAVGNVFMNVTPLPPAEALLFETSTEADNFRSTNVPPTQQEIFNNWARFENDNFFPPGTTATGDAAEWQFDSNQQQVLTTANTPAHTGFISPNLEENYQIDVTLSSVDNDDDMINFVIAFENQGSINKSLVVTRTTNGADTWGPGVLNWQISLDLKGQHSNLSTTVIQRNTSSLTAPPVSGWGGSGVTRIRVQRQGDQIDCFCSQFGSTTLEPPTQMTVDLSSRNDLSWARGPKSFGYSAMSQEDATFSNIQLSGTFADQSRTYDIETGKVFEFVTGTGWVELTNTTIADELGFPREITNPETGQTFFIDNDKNITEI